MDITKKIEKAHSNGHLDKAATPSGKPEGNEINEPSQAYILMHAALFLATGICSTICNQMVFYHGASQPKSMLLSFPTYIGMILVVLLPLPKSAHKGVHSTSSQTVFGVASADVFANVACMVGLQFVGSGIFQVLYASVVCFTALLSKAFLGKTPSRIQWLGIFAIASGLCLTSHGSAPAHLQTDAGLVLLGIGITLVGCVGYASVYVTVESILSKGNSIEPQRLCVRVGLFGTLVHLLYMSGYTFPYFDELILKNITAHGGDLNTVAILYLTLVLSAFIHNWNYFFLLRYSGAVTTGVISALRAIGVFIVSGWLFCADHSSQCMTTQKSFAALVVASGVLLYSFGKKKGKPPPKKKTKEDYEDDCEADAEMNPPSNVADSWRRPAVSKPLL